MPNQALATICEPRSKPSDSHSRSLLIRKWVTAFALNAGACLEPDSLAAFESLWTEGFSDLPDRAFEAACRKALRECAFWPVKVADIRKHIAHAEKNAADSLAEEAWETVLDIRRSYWSPDAPGGFWSGAPVMSDRMSTASRAAGVFREHESVESLKVWAKKRFVESFLAYEEMERDKFLLPGGEDGELRKLLALVSHQRSFPALPASAIVPPEERLRVVDQLAHAAREAIAAFRPQQTIVIASEDDRKNFDFKADLIIGRFPTTSEPDPVIAPYVRASAARREKGVNHEI
jgi:hypothetical protein